MHLLTQVRLFMFLAVPVPSLLLPPETYHVTAHTCLKVDGTTIAQSGAIERYVAKLANFYPSDL